MSVPYKIPRGTRASLNAKASAGTITVGQPYLITDENRLAVGLTTTTYQDYALRSEAGGGGGGVAHGAAGQVLRTAADGATVEFEQDFGLLATVAGSYYPPDSLITGNSGAACVANQLYLLPFFRGGKFDAMGIQVTTATSSAQVRLGLYDSTSSGLPGALIEEPTAVTPVAANSTGSKLAMFSTDRVLTRPAWVAFLGSAVIPISIGTSATNRANALLGQPAQTGAASTIINGLFEAYAFAALPASLAGAAWSTLPGSGSTPMVMMRGAA